MDCTWEFQTARDVAHKNELLKKIHEIFLDGFNKATGWGLDGIQKSLYETSVLGLLTGADDEVYGYSMYFVPKVPLRGKFMMWEDAICLRKVAQGQGLAAKTFPTISKLFPNYRFGWLGGRTQNPIMFRRYAQFGKTFPFDSTYETSEGKTVLSYLRKFVVEVRDVKYLDSKYGICRGVYREGRLGDYPVDVVGSSQYEKFLSRWNFNRDAGDALVVVSKLN